MNATIAERFQKNTADHEMTVLHNEGMYRHVRFRSPERGAYWFDLITWPGSLTVNGDCGTFTFSRLDDMFEFFRGGYINPQYWAEKVRAQDPSGVSAYSMDVFRQQVTEEIKGAEADWPGLGAAVEERIFGPLAEWNVEYEHDARAVLNQFEYLPEGATGEPFRFLDAWQWDLTDYHWQFLWCCHAIQWGVAQYDASKAVAA